MMPNMNSRIPSIIGWKLMRLKALLFGIIITGSLLFVKTANAHSAYLRSNPGDEAILTSSPLKVDIWFSQELFRRRGENLIRVSRSDGLEVSIGETQMDDDDRTHIWIDLLPNLPAGKYLVEWKSLSVEDGHSSEGSFNFMIDPQAEVTSTPMEESNSSVLMTNAFLPTSAPPDSTPQPAPTTAPVTADRPCAAGLLPLGGLIIFDVTRRFRRK